ncbi:hypothetical protein Tsubulata_017832 [Turnera subulata]|uniref:HTH myb-type domain-containing protein n=1 Tax=Turnera subulata TaxID=218843 RepID=A0A9Q0FBA7_9ROSI|nr:hypothetical protein Tsubulata_017832 [Turnera subulata]
MELSLDLSLAYVPKTISDCLREISRVEDGTQKLAKIDDYMKRLEDERKKIDAFKRELPLCMLLLNDAIMRLQEESLHCKEANEDHQAVIEEVSPVNGNGGCDDKRNWLSAVQLWNSDSFDGKQQDSMKSELKQGQRTEEDDDRSTCENPIQSVNHRNGGGGAFVPFKRLPSGVEEGTERKEEKEVVSQVTGLSLMTPGSEQLGSCNLISKSNGSNQIKMKSKPQQPPQQLQKHNGCRKQRRSWSPELHRRFVDALQQLGGSQVATPKQIRDLMQVDGLTNDEVKSHLQKYRLHIRKLPASPASLPSGLWTSQDSNLNNEQSNSPRGPLHANGTTKSISNSGVDSMEADDDDRSESHSWNGGIRKPGEVTVN